MTEISAAFAHLPMAISWMSGLFHFRNFSSKDSCFWAHSSTFLSLLLPHSLSPPVLAASLLLHSQSLLLNSPPKQSSHPGLSSQLLLYLLTLYCLVLLLYLQTLDQSNHMLSLLTPRQANTARKIPFSFVDRWHCWEVQDFENTSKNSVSRKHGLTHGVW